MSKEFFINVYRADSKWYGLLPGELFTMQGVVPANMAQAIREAQLNAGVYHHTVTHNGVIDIRKHFVSGTGGK